MKKLFLLLVLTGCAHTAPKVDLPVCTGGFSDYDDTLACTCPRPLLPHMVVQTDGSPTCECEPPPAGRGR